MKSVDIKKRINELIAIADDVLSTRTGQSGYGDYVDAERFNMFRSVSLSFIRNVYGQTHPYFIEFYQSVEDTYTPNTQKGKGILSAIKNEIDGDWFFSFRSLVSSEIFSDFMEMAEYLLNEGYKDAAAVMIGSVLEEHLRQLCGKYLISVELEKEGKIIAKRADVINSDLCKAEVYNKLVQKQITAWLDLRNNAAHGKYNEYSKEQVHLMLSGVLDFLNKSS